MKRKIFAISTGGQRVATKFAWNTAVREVPKLIEETLKTGETASFIEIADKIKDDYRNHVHGVSRWVINHNDGSQTTVEYKIEKV